MNNVRQYGSQLSVKKPACAGTLNSQLMRVFIFCFALWSLFQSLYIISYINWIFFRSFMHKYLLTHCLEDMKSYRPLCRVIILLLLVIFPTCSLSCPVSSSHFSSTHIFTQQRCEPACLGGTIFLQFSGKQTPSFHKLMFRSLQEKIKYNTLHTLMCSFLILLCYIMFLWAPRGQCWGKKRQILVKLEKCSYEQLFVVAIKWRMKLKSARSVCLREWLRSICCRNITI